jgi:hypothetical protein
LDLFANLAPEKFDMISDASMDAMSRRLPARCAQGRRAATDLRE